LLLNSTSLYRHNHENGSALAQTTPQTPRVDQREAKQQQRSEQDNASAQLPGTKAARLEKGHAKIEAKEAAAKADGVVTGTERAQLHKAQNKQSRKIYKQKHNSQTKPAPAR
jgi:hypothetical protein